MKNSNKISFFYIVSSLLLFVVLVGGGIYGFYVSIGNSFLNSGNVVGENLNMSNIARNVSYSNNIETAENVSVSGVVILSVVLLILAVFDFVSMIKQIIFFKQFKPVNNSAVVKVIEIKNTKRSVVVFALILDVLSFVVGGLGIYVNMNSFIGFGSAWVLYVIDGLVCLFALLSFIFLLIKLKKVKNLNKITVENHASPYGECKKFDLGLNPDKIDDLEYCLLKLKNLKRTKDISVDEYDNLRKKLMNNYQSEDKEKDKTV